MRVYCYHSRTFQEAHREVDAIIEVKDGEWRIKGDTDWIVPESSVAIATGTMVPALPGYFFLTFHTESIGNKEPWEKTPIVAWLIGGGCLSITPVTPEGLDPALVHSNAWAILDPLGQVTDPMVGIRYPDVDEWVKDQLEVVKIELERIAKERNKETEKSP